MLTYLKWNNSINSRGLFVKNNQKCIFVYYFMKTGGGIMNCLYHLI